jgi:hypothetical protein
MAQADKSHPFGWLIESLAVDGQAASPGLRPKPAPRPDFQADLVRPDDLLALHVDGYNLHVVPGDDTPTIDRIDAAKDAFLVVTFPPQNIAETAYFETTGTNEPPLPPGIPAPPAGFPPAGSPPPPGRTGARLARFSRLVFRAPAGAALTPIAYSIEGLLDWSGLDLAVSALADLPPAPSAAQIAGPLPSRSRVPWKRRSSCPTGWCCRRTTPLPGGMRRRPSPTPAAPSSGTRASR